MWLRWDSSEGAAISFQRETDYTIRKGVRARVGWTPPPLIWWECKDFFLELLSISNPFSYDKRKLGRNGEKWRTRQTAKTNKRRIRGEQETGLESDRKLNDRIYISCTAQLLISPNVSFMIRNWAHKSISWKGNLSRMYSVSHWNERKSKLYFAEISTCKIIFLIFLLWLKHQLVKLKEYFLDSSSSSHRSSP